MKILITGSGSGIGRFLAEALSGAGNEVWGIALGEQTTPFRFNTCDVSDWLAVERVEREVGREWGSLDALICCAGAQGAMGKAMDLDPREWSQTVRVNLDGTFYPIRAFFGLLAKAKRRAKVLCFSGGGSTSPRPNFSAYGVAKTGVVRLVETLAEEWKGDAIDINGISPGAIYTRMTEEVLALGPGVAGEKEYAQAQKTKAQGAAPLEKAGELVKFLLSPESDGISGKLISAPWDPWAEFGKMREELMRSEIYTLRRVAR